MSKSKLCFKTFFACIYLKTNECTDGLDYNVNVMNKRRSNL